MRITFLGAAGEVTGSQHLIETTDRRILLDCGMFQGPRAAARHKNEDLYCSPKTLDAVILSHAHIDHSGRLPQLYRNGFRGPVFCTEATADISEMMLLDSAKIQVEDAKYLRRRLKPGHPSVEPLYTEEDVDGIMRLFEPFGFHEWHTVGADVRVRFQPAGHILGSAIVELEVIDEGEWRRVVFTGDLGRRDMPLLVDPVPVEGADVLICESTYGGAVHPSSRNMEEQLREILHTTCERQGRVVIPAFSLGRTQQVVYFLNELFNEGSLPRMPIFVDSPLATRLTKIFRRYNEIMNEDVQETLQSDDDPFGFESLTYVRNQSESMALNDRNDSFVVISAGGMCEGGRVVHHLRHTVSDERNTIVLMGYQAPHTLGRQLADHRPYVKIFDREQPLRANVVEIDGLSAHADATDFRWWFEESTRNGHFGETFLVHGEGRALEAMSSAIRDFVDVDPVIPRFRQTVTVTY